MGNRIQNKKLLILGAGRGQIGLYRAARDLGVKTIAGTMPDNNPPCIPMADEVCYMNILDPNEVESKTSMLKFDGVATCCLDSGLRSLGRIVDRRGVPGYGEKTAMMCNDKSMMKRRLIECGVNTAPFVEVTDVDSLYDGIKQLGGYPVIIKATDLAGSMGIYKALNEDEALNGFNAAMSMTKRNCLIVERLLRGREFGAQAFVSCGEVLFVLPHGDILFHGATDIPVGHYVPFDCDADLAERIRIESEKAINAIGLDNCAVNIDFIEEDGNVYVLELSGRIGANGLPEVVGAHFGINYYKMVILASLGLPVDKIWAARGDGMAALSKMIFSPNEEGRLREISYGGDKDNPHLYDINLFAKPGFEVHRFMNSNHCLGQVITFGRSLKECSDAMTKVYKDLKLVIE